MGVTYGIGTLGEHMATRVLLTAQSLPDAPVYRGVRVAGPLTALLQPSVHVWSLGRLIKNHDSLGLVVADPALETRSGYRSVRDNPKKLIWAKFSWGANRDKLVLNAACMMRAAARTGRDTFDLQRNAPDLFQDVVEEGSCLWGDIPRGGATFVDIGGRTLLVAIDGLEPGQNDWLAKLAGGFLGNLMLDLDRTLDEGTAER